MNQEALATLSPTLFVNAKTIEALSKMCNPLASIITPETARVLAGITSITPEIARVAAALSAKTEQHTKIEKLMDSILPLPSRR